MKNIEEALAELKEICDKLEEVEEKLESMQGTAYQELRKMEGEVISSMLNDVFPEYEDKANEFGDSILTKIFLIVFNTLNFDKIHETIDIENERNLYELVILRSYQTTRLKYNPLDIECPIFKFDDIIHISSELKQYPYYNKQIFLNLTKLLKKCSKWLEYWYKYANQENKCEFNEKQLDYALVFFDIQGYQCIKQISENTPIDAQFITFVGDNGDGKTSILQALGLGMCNSNALSDDDRGEGSAIQVQYKDKHTKRNWHNEIYNLLNHREIDSKFLFVSSLRHKMHEIKPFACYGASRLQVADTKELQNPLLNLYPERAKLANIFSEWLPRLSVNKPAQFEQVKALLIKLLPNVSDIVKKNENEIISDFLFVEKGKKVEFKHLSAGHKSLVLMIGDMLMRLAQAQPEIEDPHDFVGIVLIDELESHLHPKWQREFPRILSETFPKVQFIVTTHSAITLLGMPRNTVFFKVSRTEEAGTQIERIDIDIENLLPNAIYTSPLFGLENIRSVNNTGIEKLRVEDSFADILKDEETSQLLKNLATKYKPKNV